MTEYTIAIVGNPNCGKTTLFNRLTGARQRVGNWAGVTVEQKTGAYRSGDRAYRVVDLPGVYSLSAAAGADGEDQRVARDFALSGRADVIVNIVDAGNLERNLFLTAQLLEMGVPLVLALNMTDVAGSRGLVTDLDRLRRYLNVPTVAIVATRGDGIAGLMAAIDETAGQDRRSPATVPRYETALEAGLARLESALSGAGLPAAGRRWMAAQLLEGDCDALSLVSPEVRELRDEIADDVERHCGEDADSLIADGRYGFVNDLCRAAQRQAGPVQRPWSDLIDSIVLNRWLGPVIFLAAMYLMFTVTINIGGAFVDFFDLAVGAVTIDAFGALLSELHAPLWLRVVLADGVGGGVAVVATFVPIVGCLYLFLAILEDSGYMARAAFVMDRLMRLIGLPGKAFVPLIVGFGCNVPAVLATRTLERRSDRILTAVMTPFMSCGARLAVYALFAAAFFPVGGERLVFGLYLVGVAVAILTGLLVRRTLLGGEAVPLVMELPPYRIPTLRDILLHGWFRLRSFVLGAGKVIILVVTLLSLVSSLGTDGSFGNQNNDKSLLSVIGRALVPPFAPMGIDEDNWPALVGILSGVFAKEAVVGTLDALYSASPSEAAPAAAPQAAASLPAQVGRALLEAAATIPENLSLLAARITDPLGLADAQGGDPAAAAANQGVAAGTFGTMIQRFDGTAGAVAYLLFILLYMPCAAVTAALYREVGPRWCLFAAVWTTGVAYVVSVAAYQTATFARHPTASTAWLVGLALALVGAVLSMYAAGRRRMPRALAGGAD